MSRKKQCGYVYDKGKLAKRRCPVKVRNETQHYCSKHLPVMQKRESVKKVNISSDPIFGGTSRTNQQTNQQTNQTNKQKKHKRDVRIVPTKEKFSSWIITINTGKDFRTMSQQEKQRFKKFSEYLFSDAHGRRPAIIDFLKDMHSVENDPDQNMINYDIQHQYEVGKRFAKLHTHALLRATHAGHYKVDVYSLRSFAKRVFGYTPHIDVGGGGDSARAMEAYVNKNQGDNIISL